MPDIFLHIRKTGGTTLRTALRWVYGPSSCYAIPPGSIDEPEQWFKNVTEDQLKSIGLVMGHAPYGIHKYFNEKCRYFTILRNPVDRVVSRYYSIRNGYMSSEDSFQTLKQFVGNRRGNHQVRMISGKDPSSNPKESLNLAKEVLTYKIKSFGITERYDESLVLIKEDMEWVRYPFYVRGKTTSERPSVEDLSRKKSIK